VYNWSVDTARLKRNRQKREKWKIEQLVNFGLGNEKIFKKLLVKFWPELNLDPVKKRLLKLIL